MVIKNWIRILADDMGLGKTAQAIIAANKYIKRTPLAVFNLCLRNLIKLV